LATLLDFPNLLGLGCNDTQITIVIRQCWDCGETNTDFFRCCADDVKDLSLPCSSWSVADKFDFDQLEYVSISFLKLHCLSGKQMKNVTGKQILLTLSVAEEKEVEF